MNILAFDPFTHFEQVAALWEQSLGASYPVSQRILSYRLCSRPTLEPGDGVVIFAGNKIVGFGMVEIERKTGERSVKGFIQAIMVHPEWQRQGMGSAILKALENRLRSEGCSEVELAGGASRFWSGLPCDLPPAKQFFLAQGYTLESEVADLILPLQNYQVNAHYREQLRLHSIHMRCATELDMAALLDFQTREFPHWRGNMIALVHAGDISHILVLWHGSEIVGTLLTFTPQSRHRGPNLVWESIFGAAMGGFGTVGIAKAWRGKGLGAAMCQEACLHVQNLGGDCCFIDWTGIADFYTKLGAKVWRTFWRGGKSLAG